MSFFKELEGEAAVLVQNGVYQQVPLFIRDGYLYAKLGSGFIRLMADGSTTKAQTRLDFMSSDQPLRRDALGRLCTDAVKGATSLDDKQAQLLLGGTA